MWEQVFNLAVNNGLWAVLFLLLLVYQLRDSREREKKYQKTITDLNNSLNIVKEVKNEVTEINKNVKKTAEETKIVNKKIITVEKDIKKINKTLNPTMQSGKISSNSGNNETIKTVKI